MVALLFVSSLVALPLLVEWQGQRWLAQQGVVDADIGDVDINLFTGEVVVTGLVVGREAPSRFTLASAYVNVAYLPLLQRRIQIQSVRLSGLDLDLALADGGGVQLGALRLPVSERGARGSTEPAPEGGGGWGFGLGAVALEGLTVRAHTPQHEGLVVVQQLRVGELASWLSERPAPLSLKMEIDGARFELNSDAAPFKAEPDWRATLVLEEVELANYAPFLAAAGLERVAGRLALAGEVSGRWREDETLALQFDLELTGEGLQFDHPEAAFSQDGLSWQGEGALHLPPREGERLLHLDSRLALTQTQLRLADGRVVSQAGLQWQGVVDYGPGADAAAGIGLQGRLSLKGGVLQDPAAGLVLARFDALGLDGVDVAGLKRMAVQRLTLQGLALLADPSSQVAEEGAPSQMLALERLDIASLALRDRHAGTIETIDLKGLQLAALLDESGRMRWLDRLTPEAGGEKGAAVSDDGPPAAAPDGEPAGSAGGEAAAQGAPFTVRIGRIAVAGDSWLLFEDASVTPPFHARLAPLALTVEHLDSSQPETAAQLVLDSRLDQYTELKLAGRFWPFQEAFSSDITGALTGLDLSSLSPYAVAHMGYALRRGQLDNRIDLRIDKGALEINNRLHISKLNIAEADPEKASEFSAGLAMPLDMALGLLKDGDGNIEFDMPVTGDLDAPEFSMSGVINLALGKALKMAAMNYVTNALQPLGTLVFVGKLLGKAMALRFKPLTFDAGSREINATGREYAEKIATMVSERPALKLTFCGVANSDDMALIGEALLTERPAGGGTEAEQGGERGAPAEPDPELLKARALELARARGEALKAFFVEERGIDAGRLFACRPLLDLEVESAPRVEISL